jgi:hypothetical protein
MKKLQLSAKTFLSTPSDTHIEADAVTKIG